MEVGCRSQIFDPTPAKLVCAKPRPDQGSETSLCVACYEAEAFHLIR